MAVNGNDKVYCSKKLPEYSSAEFLNPLITFLIFRSENGSFGSFSNFLLLFSKVLFVQFGFYSCSYLFT